MTFNIIGLIFGLIIFGAGIYYLLKEKEDKESQKIYKITTAVGAIIIVFIIFKEVLEIM